MEDAHTHILSLPGDQDTSFFGVFDGHGGQLVLPFCFLLHFFVRCIPGLPLFLENLETWISRGIPKIGKIGEKGKSCSNYSCQGKVVSSILPAIMKAMFLPDFSFYYQ